MISDKDLKDRRETRERLKAQTERQEKQRALRAKLASAAIATQNARSRLYSALEKRDIFASLNIRFDHMSEC